MKIQLGLASEKEAQPSVGDHVYEEVDEDLLDEAVYTPNQPPVKEKVYTNPVGIMWNG